MITNRLANSRLHALLAAGCSVAFAARCFGQASISIPVANSGFESPPTTGIASPDSWTLLGGTTGSYNPYSFGGGDAFYLGANSSTASSAPVIPGTDGQMVAFVYASGPGSGLQQTLSGAHDTLEAGMFYTLTVGVGERNGSEGALTLGSEIDLLAGSTVIASSTSVTPVSGSFVDQVALLPNSDAYASLIGQPLTIRMTTTDQPAGANSTDWDNVRLTMVPAPEPSSAMAFAGLGLAAIYAGRRLSPWR